MIKSVHLPNYQIQHENNKFEYSKGMLPRNKKTSKMFRVKKISKQCTQKASKSGHELSNVLMETKSSKPLTNDTRLWRTRGKNL